MNLPIIKFYFRASLLMICVAITVFFSSCTKVDLNSLTGIYVGNGCAGGFVQDSTGSNVQYVTTCEQAQVNVIINPDRDDKLRIIYNGKKDVTVDKNLKFDDNDGYTGMFYGDSLKIEYTPNWTQAYSFKGKKQ